MKEPTTADAPSLAQADSGEPNRREAYPYQALLDHTTDLILTVQRDGRLEYVNQTCRDRLGYSETDLPTLRLDSIVARGGALSLDRALKSVLDDGERVHIETDFVKRNGELLPVAGGLSPQLVDARPVAAIGIFRDVSERNKLQQMKHDFLASVSHELRTPLASVIACLDLLSDADYRAAEPQRTQELITMASRNGDRLQRLIDDLLDLQRIRTSQLTYLTTRIEIGPLLGQAVEAISVLAETRNATVEQLEPDCALSVMADRDRLLQVLDNLLSNAIKYSTGDRQGHVTVSATALPGSVRMSIADDGPGIPSEFVDQLFDQFTQVDSSQTRRVGGSGLGLYIVKHLIRGMSGSVEVETTVGAGSVFHVTLPASD